MNIFYRIYKNRAKKIKIEKGENKNKKNIIQKM